MDEERNFTIEPEDETPTQPECPQPETPEADAGTDALQKAQEEKNRIITANAR